MKTIEWVDIYPASPNNEHDFYCEASDIGLPPGGWPRFLKTGLGNGQDFVRQHWKDNGYLYHQQDGNIRLLVIND